MLKLPSLYSQIHKSRLLYIAGQNWKQVKYWHIGIVWFTHETLTCNEIYENADFSSWLSNLTYRVVSIINVVSLQDLYFLGNVVALREINEWLPNIRHRYTYMW